MKPIARTLRTFLRALRYNLPVVCTLDGKWTYENAPKRLWHKLIGDSSNNVLTIAKGFLYALDELENTPVNFGVKQQKSLLLYVKATKAVLMKLESTQHRYSSVFTELSRRFIALLYRLEDINGGFSRRSPDPGDEFTLRQITSEWKAQNPLIAKKELSQAELNIVRETCTYPLFMDLLLASKEIQDQFFGWIVRDKNHAGTFIQFPAMQQKLTASSLGGRIGRVNPDMLKIQRVPFANGFRKELTLPFEGVDVNILDAQLQHTFTNDYTLQVSEVFHIFEEKYAAAGNLELLAQGVCNWDYLKCARWDAKNGNFKPININRQDWWKELPPLETLSKKQAQERYGDHIDGENWNVAAAASRGSATLDYESTHAYLNIAIPNGDGSYNVYDFGKLANVFPTTFLEKISVFAFNVHASVAYPDESIFYTAREHTYYSIPMTTSQAAGVMESIRLDMIISRENHFVYQIESDNCARWAQHKIEAGVGEDLLPNLFQMHLLATEPTGFTKWLFAAIRKAPLSLRTFILTRLHFPLGAGIGTWIIEQGTAVRKSLSRHEFFETGLVYLPAYLHRQQEIGLLGYVVDSLAHLISKASDTFENLFVLFTNNHAKAMPSRVKDSFYFYEGAFPPHLKYVTRQTDAFRLLT